MTWPGSGGAWQPSVAFSSALHPSQPPPPPSGAFAATPCGLFVSQSSLIAALPTSDMAAAAMEAACSWSPVGVSTSSVRPGLVVTVECGGFLRLRDLTPNTPASTPHTVNNASAPSGGGGEGLVRYQCRLPHGGEASCACWCLAGPSQRHQHPRSSCQSPPLPPSLQSVAVAVIVGLLSGGLATYRVTGESLVELRTVAWLQVPVRQLCALAVWCHHGNASGGCNGGSGGSSISHSLVLSVGVDGVLALWAATDGSDGGGGGGLARLSETPTTPASCGAAPAVADAGPALPLSCINDATGTTIGEECCYCFANCVPAGLEGDLSIGGQSSSSSSSLAVTCAILLRCSWESRSRAPPTAWALLKTYAAPAGDGAVVSLTPTAGGLLWGGTDLGGLLVWESETCALARRIRLPTGSPVHALTATTPLVGSSSSSRRGWASSGRRPASAYLLPPAVWACQLDGTVTAWEGSAFSLLQRLTLGYPPHPQQHQSSSSQQRGDSAAAAVTVSDAVDLTRALATWRLPRPEDISGGGYPNGYSSGVHPPPLPSPRHFTVCVAPLEPVLVWRTWSLATDGTVRAWLVPAATGVAIAGGGCGFLNGGCGSDADADADALDPTTVRTFVAARAAELSEAQSALAAEREAHQLQIQRLTAVNGELSAALQAAEERLQALEENGGGGRGSNGHVVTDEVATPPPPPTAAATANDSRTSGSPTRAPAALSSLLLSLQQRLDRCIGAEEAMHDSMLAARLRGLGEGTGSSKQPVSTGPAALVDADDSDATSDSSERDSSRAHHRRRHRRSSGKAIHTKNEKKQKNWARRGDKERKGSSRRTRSTTAPRHHHRRHSSSSSDSHSSSHHSKYTSDSTDWDEEDTEGSEVALVAAWSSTPMPVVGNLSPPSSHRSRSRSGSGSGGRRCHRHSARQQPAAVVDSRHGPSRAFRQREQLYRCPTPPQRPHHHHLSSPAGPLLASPPLQPPPPPPLHPHYLKSQHHYPQQHRKDGTAATHGHHSSNGYAGATSTLGGRSPILAPDMHLDASQYGS